MDSSRILLPIRARGEHAGGPGESGTHEGWIINTGNLNITNDRPGMKSNQWFCDEGYNPINLRITDISMVHADDIEKWQESISTGTSQLFANAGAAGTN